MRNTNLLCDHWLTVKTINNENLKVSLPQLLELHGKGQIAAFPMIRAHQNPTFHVFTVQLAAMALEDRDETSLLSHFDKSAPWTALKSYSEDEWRKMLRGLTEDFPGDEPWTLVVEDLSMPAFLQAPVPEANLDKFKGRDVSPDDADLIISTKNHDTKATSLINGTDEAWIFALLSLQTNSGFLGRGNYGIARQNGGWGSRPIFTLQSSSLPSSRWARDLYVLLSDDRLEPKEKKLLWLDPWDGEKSSCYDVDDLHPLCIEICRRLRMKFENDKLILCRSPSASTRIAAQELHGDLGDPWEPIIIDKNGQTKVFSGHLNYSNIARILSEDEGCYMPLLMKFNRKIDSRTNAQVWCSTLIKGQGKTDGYEERTISVDSYDLDIKRLNAISRQMLLSVNTAKNKVLSFALGKALIGCKANDGDGSVDFGSTVMKQWVPSVINTMDSEIDDKFFDFLWKALKTEDGSTDEWTKCLRSMVRKYYRIGLESLPGSSIHNMKSISVGEIILEKLIKKNLELKEEQNGGQEHNDA